MKIVLSDRSPGAAMPDAVRDRLVRRLEQLGRHLDLVTAADVVVDVQARRPRPVYTMEITLALRGHHLPSVRTRREGREIAGLADDTVATLDREVRRLKERLKTHP